ncbi:MAG: zf-HC2 domain-containing protein [Desulfosarcina sp.]
MPHARPICCDDRPLDRFLDGELDAEDRHPIKDHLMNCPECRRQAVAMLSFAKRFRERVRQAADSVDFVACEKEVLIKALRQRRFRTSSSAVSTSLKYVIPALLTVGLVLFFIISSCSWMVPTI